jgi:glycosyltransferase involved in cell wall biosynthesis
MIGLSALVVAHNEAEQLGACLSCLSFADEIVVVLDRSTDASRAIALAYGAKLVEGAWPIEGDRRAAGVEACSAPFVLEVDADERVTSALAEEIKQTLTARAAQAEGSAKGFDWWRIPFDNYVGTRLVRYGWGAHMGVGAKAALFRKGVKSWARERVHPKVVMTGVSGGALQNRMVHYLDRDVADMKSRFVRYTELRAQDLADSGKCGTLGKNILRIFGRFWKCYILRQGFREGKMGFTIASLAAFYPLVSYLKAVEILKKKS